MTPDQVRHAIDQARANREEVARECGHYLGVLLATPVAGQGLPDGSQAHIPPALACEMVRDFHAFSWQSTFAMSNQVDTLAMLGMLPDPDDDTPEANGPDQG